MKRNNSWQYFILSTTYPDGRVHLMTNILQAGGHLMITFLQDRDHLMIIFLQARGHLMIAFLQARGSSHDHFSSG